MVPKSYVSEVLCELADYTRDHFGREENLMRVTKFPRCVEHVVEHWKFIQKLSALIDRFERRQPDVLKECRTFLIDWLVAHISVEDREFGEYLKGMGGAVTISVPC